MIRYRSKIVLILVAVLAVLLLGGCGSNSDVKIGFVGPLSGPNAGEGRAAYNAFCLAFEKADLPMSVEVVKADDEGEAEKGIEVVRDLLTDNKVVAAAGFYNTWVAENTIGQFVSKQCPLIIWGTNAAKLTVEENYPYVLRALGTEMQENVMLAELICDTLKQKRVYIIADNSGVAAERAENFRNRITAYSGALKGMATVTVDAGETELGEIAAAVAASGADVLYYTGDAGCGGRVAAAVRKVNSAITFCTTSGVAGSAYIAAAGKAAEGTIAVRQGIDLQATEEGRGFVAAYEAAGFEEPLGVYSVQAYYAAQLIIAALQNAENVNGPAIAEALTSGSLSGVLGDTTFGADGQALNSAFYPVVCMNGVWQSYTIVNAEPEEPEK